MVANTSLAVSSAQFDELKLALNNRFASNPQFSDYDFAGSSIATLVDVLAYNTYLNLFYNNMAVNETFLKTAVQRDSVVSRAAELNYVPRSFKSAIARVNVSVTSNNVSRAAVIMQKGSMFTSRVGDKNYTFTTDKTIVAENVLINSNNTVTYSLNDVEIFQGQYISETFSFNPANDMTIIIQNQQIDTDSLTVTLIEDNGATIIPYKHLETLYDVQNSPAGYFIGTATNSRYQIEFISNTFGGRVPKTNSLVLVEYRVSDGELPNGCRVFTPSQSIDSETNVTVATVTPAHSGAIHESADDIKQAASKHFETQGRGVIEADYVRLLKEKFPEIIDVNAYGGETIVPPRYGKVMIAVATSGATYASQQSKIRYKDYLRSRNSLTIEPVLVDPNVVFVEISTIVKFDPSATSLGVDDIKTLVLSAITTFATVNVNRFNGVLYRSKLSTKIDNAHASIISNDTTFRLSSVIRKEQWAAGTVSLDYQAAIVPASFVSNGYRSGNINVRLVDDGLGNIYQDGDAGKSLSPVGTIDYAKGTVSLTAVRPDTLVTSFKSYVTPVSNDISGSNNTIIKVVDSTIAISVVK